MLAIRGGIWEAMHDRNHRIAESVCRIETSGEGLVQDVPSADREYRTEKLTILLGDPISIELALLNRWTSDVERGIASCLRWQEPSAPEGPDPYFSFARNEA